MKAVSGFSLSFQCRSVVYPVSAGVNLWTVRVRPDWKLIFQNQNFYQYQWGHHEQSDCRHLEHRT